MSSARLRRGTRSKLLTAAAAGMLLVTLLIGLHTQHTPEAAANGVCTLDSAGLLTYVDDLGSSAEIRPVLTNGGDYRVGPGCTAVDPSTVNSVVIAARDGNNTIRLDAVDYNNAGFPSGLTIEIRGGSEPDQFVVQADQVPSAGLVVLGGNSEDSLTVIGTESGDAISVNSGGNLFGTVVSGSVQFSGFGSIGYRNVENLTIEGRNNNDVFTYRGAGSSTRVLLLGQGGGDTFSVIGEPGPLGLKVDGGLSVGLADALEVTASADNFSADSITLDGHTVTIDTGMDTSSGVVTYAGVRRVLLDGFQGTDTITALATPPEVVETVLRGTGNDDTIAVTMAGLESPVTVLGNVPGLVPILDQAAGRPFSDALANDAFIGDGNVLALDARGLNGLTFDTRVDPEGSGLLRETITAASGQRVEHREIGLLAMTVDAVNSSIAGITSLHPFTDHEITDGAATLRPPTIIAVSPPTGPASGGNPVSILGTNLEAASVTFRGVIAQTSFDTTRRFDHASFPLTSGLEDDGVLGNGLGVLNAIVPTTLTSGVARIVVTNSSGSSVAHNTTISAALDGKDRDGNDVSAEFLDNAFNDLYIVGQTGAAPTITSVPSAELTLADPPYSATFSVDDAETSPSTLPVTASSDNQTVLPNANIALTALGGGNWRIEVTPAAIGSARVTLGVTDSDFNLATESFSVLVGVPNQPPTIEGSLPNVVITVGQSIAPRQFMVSDLETPIDELIVAVVADNPSLLPVSGVSLTPTLIEGQFDLALTPVPNTVGATLVTVSVTDDHGATAVREFDVLVRAAGESRPLTGSDTFSTPAGVLLDVPPAGVLANDFEPDGQGMTAVLVPGSFDATQGSLSLAADGGFTFTSTSTFSGVATFRYRAVDSAGTPSLATTVSIFVAGSTSPGPIVDEGALAGTLDEFIAVDVDGNGSVGGNDESLDGRTLTSIAQAILGATTYTGAGTLSVLVSVDGAPPVEPANATLAVGGPFTLTWQVRANTVPAQFSQPLTQGATVLGGDDDQDDDGLTNGEEEAIGSDPLDPCSPLDVTGDGAINLSDLLFIIARLGLNDEPALDFDQSGVVDLSDVLAVVGAFGTTCS